MASTGASAAANGSGSGPSSYTGKAHELIPEFSGKANDYKEYRKRVLLYERKMDLAGRKSEFAFNIMSSLKNRAWDACEDLSMEVLDSDTDMKEILQRLDAVFKYDAITELPQDFENFFIQMQRKRNETMQEYTANFERQLRRLAAHEVAHPEKVIGWYYLRRAGLSQQQRQLIMSTITTSTLSLDSVRKAVNFVIGQDQTPEGSAGRDTRFNKLKDTYIYNLADDSWSYEPEPDDAYYEDAESWEIGPEDSMSQILWHDEPAPPETDEEQVLMAMDAASEYDDIMANYVEARSKLNQLRVSRGYYPVVAMVPEQRNYTGGAGKGKGKKGKVKGKGKQQPKPPSAKARGRAALGAIKSRKVALASWSCSCFSKLSDGVDAPQKPPPARGERDHQAAAAADHPAPAAAAAADDPAPAEHPAQQRPAQQRQQQQQQTTQRQQQQQQHTNQRRSSSSRAPTAAAAAADHPAPAAAAAADDPAPAEHPAPQRPSLTTRLSFTP